MTAWTEGVPMQPAHQKSAAFWDKIAAKYVKQPIADEAAYEDTLARVRTHLKPTDQVLELGCGTGMTALKLADAVAEYTATDISAEMVRMAEGRLIETPNPKVRFAQAEVGAAPEGPFDAVLAFNLYHLVDDVPAALTDAAARLKPGGLLIQKTGCLGAKAWFLVPMIWAMRLVGKAPKVKVFNAAELERMVERAGFEIVDATSYAGIAETRFIVARKR